MATILNTEPITSETTGYSLIEEHLTGTPAECRRMVARVLKVTGKNLHDWSPEEWDRGLLEHLITADQAQTIARQTVGARR